MLDRLADFIVRRRRMVRICLAVLTIVAAAFALRVDFDFSPQAVLAGHDQMVEYSEQFKQTFGFDDTALLVVLQADGQRDVLDREALTWQKETAIRLGALPDVRDIESLATLKLPRARVFGPPWITSVPVVRELPVDQQGEERVRAVVDRSALLQGSLVSGDKKMSLIVVSMTPEARDLASTQRVIASINGVLDAHPAPEGYHLWMSGLPTLRVDIVDQLMADQMFLLPLAGLMFVMVLTLLFRSFSAVVLPLAGAGMGLIWTVGALSATGQSLNIISNSLPVLLLILGVANGVHIVSRYGEEARRYRGDREKAAKVTLAHLAFACFLTFATITIGFLSMATARSEVISAFAWQASLGMVLMYFAMVFGIGCLLPSCRPPVPITWSGMEHASPLQRALSRLCDAICQRPRTTVAICVALMAGALFSARNIVINSYMMETYDHDHPTLAAMRSAEENLGGFLPLEVSLHALGDDRFLEPAVAGKVAAFETFARKQDEVLFARSYVDLHREMDAHARGSDHAEEPRGDQEEQARRLKFTSKIFRQVGQVMNYDKFVTADGHQARIMLRVRDVGTRDTLDLVERLRQQLAVLFPASSGIEYQFTGDVYLNAQAMDVFVRDMFYSLLGASVFIFGVIGICFRSVRIGLIAVPPNIMPLIITLGYMGLRRYDMNAANVIVFDMGLGIAVDSTIHFLSRFRHEFDECGSRPDAVRRTFASTGQAIVYTSLLIVSGLAVLLLSSFVPTRRFAELTAITMTAAFLGDIVLLPACVLLFWGRRRTAEPKADHHKPGTAEGSNGSVSSERIKERPAIAGRHDRGE